MEGTIKCGLFASVAVVAVFGASSAWAQVVPAAPAPGAVKEQSSLGGSDIVVTARRREERLADVPTSVVAVSGQTLVTRGIESTGDLPKIAPGLQFEAAPSGGNTRPAVQLRGISANDVLVTQDQPVGIYVNDIYYARTAGTNLTLYDIANVQALYGPQGTLFGRNSTAGALVITSNRPTDHFEGQFWGGAGNYGRVELGGVVNVPLNDWAKFRVAGERIRTDGYTKDLVRDKRLDDQNNYSGRATLLLDPGSKFNNITVVDYFHSKSNGFDSQFTNFVPSAGRTEIVGSNASTVVRGVAASIFGDAALNAALAESKALGPFQRNINGTSGLFVRTYGVVNTTTYEFSQGLTLKNIAGYRNAYNTQAVDTDGTSLPIVASLYAYGKQHQISDELQLQGHTADNRLNVIGGLYYFRERAIDASRSNVFGAQTSTTDVLAHNTSKSIFGQATYEVLPHLSVTAGGRYTWDTREVAYRNPQMITAAGSKCNLQLAFDLQDGVADCAIKVKKKFSQPTYNFTVDYKPTRDVLVYIAHRRGYRSGGFNARATGIAAATPFDPETVKDVELGTKLRFDLGGPVLMTDFALYKTWYNNIQRNGVFLINGAAVSTINNAANATIKGFELSQTLIVSRDVSIYANWAYADGVHQKYAYASALGGFATNVAFGVSKNSVNAGATVIAFRDNSVLGTVSITGNAAYKSSFYLTQDLPVLSKLEKFSGRTVADFALDFKSIAGTKVDLQLWTHNAFNKNYVNGGLGAVTSLGIVTGIYGEPRTFGATMRYSW